MVEDFKLARMSEPRRNARDGSTVAGATVNRALTTLKLLYNHAERCGYDVSNPTRRLQFFDEGGGRMRVVSFEEETAYLAAASHPLKDIAQIILDTGLRPEEVFRIRVENLDFSGHTFNPFGKTKAARRKVTMTADVCELLKARAKQSKSAYVFPSPLNSDRPIGSVRKAHDAAVEAAGIKDHFRLYDLRHTFATRAVAAGVDLPTLSAILGHTKIAMTMRYVHPAEEQKRNRGREAREFSARWNHTGHAEKSAGHYNSHYSGQGELMTRYCKRRVTGSLPPACHAGGRGFDPRRPRQLPHSDEKASDLTRCVGGRFCRWCGRSFLISDRMRLTHEFSAACAT
jgi:integrase